MMGDIHQEVLLLKSFDDAREDDWNNLQGCRSDGGLGHEDACVKVVLADVLGKGAHLLYANACVGGELDPDGTD